MIYAEKAIARDVPADYFILFSAAPADPDAARVQSVFYGGQRVPNRSSWGSTGRHEAGGRVERDRTEE